MARSKRRGRISKQNLETWGGRARKTSTQGNKRFYPDLRLKEKAANERMRQLEKAGLNSPAYQAIQAKLEVLGKQTKGNRGRRFSETGKATYNEKELLNKILDEFLTGDTTSTLTGAREYQEKAWQTANKNNRLGVAGISQKDWLKFWESMPDRKDRLYGSDQIVAIVRAYKIKHKRIKDENELSVEEIAQAIKESENLKDAYEALGITYKQAERARIKGRLIR